jgi:hypothetical protein
VSGAYSEAMILLLAHAAHWYFWPLYAAPVLVVLWSIAMTAIRERRGGAKTKNGNEGAEGER